MELKFRAWSEKEKTMTYFGGDLLWFEEHAPEWRHEYKVMQYTGLKDKNGKEIYEGDVVLCDGRLGLVEYSTSNTAFIVRWKNKRTGEFKDYGADTLGSTFPSPTKEVIGNVYENQELLQKAENIN